jgi:hypothetical protein
MAGGLCTQMEIYFTMRSMFMNKIGRIFMLVGLTVLFTLSFNSCATSGVALSDIPPESTEPTPFEGIWNGVQSGLSYTYQFKGNTFLAKLKRTDMDKPSAWQKGVFTYIDGKISLIQTASIDPNVALVMDQPYDWVSVVGLARNGGTLAWTRKYTLNADGLTLDKTLYRNVTGSMPPMTGPGDTVYFYNANNWTANNTKNPYAFSIETIDDKKLVYVSNYLGEGYQNAVEEREPGTYKITFSQRRDNTEISGSFTKNFLPGLYRFSVFTDEYTAFMPEDLPPIPPNHARVVIIREEFGKTETLYDYIDASLRG